MEIVKKAYLFLPLDGYGQKPELRWSWKSLWVSEALDIL